MGPPEGVVLGEQGHASFTILNEGALEVHYDISSPDSQVSPHWPKLVTSCFFFCLLWQMQCTLQESMSL